MEELNNITKKILREFVYGGHLLSLGAASIVWTTVILTSGSVTESLPILFIAYLSSQLVYNIDHLKDANDEYKSNKHRTVYLASKKKLQTFLLALYSSLFLLTSFLFLNILTTALAAFIVLGGYMYTNKLKELTKHILGFKNYYVSFFWSLLALLPVTYFSTKLSSLIVVFTSYIFLRFIISTIFFDFKDVSSDSKKYLQTFPAIYGQRITVFFLHLLNLFTGFLVIWAVQIRIFPTFSIALLFFCLYCFFYLQGSFTSKQHDIQKISYLIVDGEYFLWPISLLLIELII